MDAHCGGLSRSSSSEPGRGSGILDPWHHHRVPLPRGGDGGGGGEEADEKQVQEQEPPSVPVFHLQAMRQSAEYAHLASMGDAGQSHSHHGGGFQPQLLSFGGVGRQPHQFTAQASRAEAGGEIVAAATSHSSRVTTSTTGGGEIVPAVQAGCHTVRSTGRKDQHSKVCTARGTRDRRVRLSAHTAIQFYDVQDRLGYDRPSKAVDWLISNAKDAIDKLHHTLPAWHPAASANPSSSKHPATDDNNSDDQAITVAHPGSFDFPGGTAAGGGFLPASLDSDSIIADTIKSFFPMGGTGGGEASSSSGFQSYTPDLLSRTGSHSQELRLSLPDPPMCQHHHSQQQQEHGGGNGSALFPGYSFGATWPEPAQHQRMVPWTVPDPGGCYLFNVPQQLAGGRSQFLFPRGPLQSSNNQPSDHRGWPDTIEADNHPMFGFRIPARMQGDEDHDGGGNGDKPSVSSASSHH